MKTEPIIRPLLEAIHAKGYDGFPQHFVYPSTIEKDALLFIGINPSGASHGKTIESYPLLQSGNEHVYFKPFEEIARACNVRWSHLDLLFFRETKQEMIDAILASEGGVEFIWDQLQISKSLIEKSHPQCIVVCNAKARQLMGKDRQENDNIWLGLEFTFDEEIGTWMWQNVPVFFTSMLTGQRALDKGSLERLTWQVRRGVVICKLRQIRALKDQYISEGRYEEVARLRDMEKGLGQL